MEKIKIVGFCNKVILFSIYAIAFFLPISKAIIESFATLAIIFYIIKKIIKPERISRPSLYIPIFAYLIVCFLSVFISSNFKISLRIFIGRTVESVAFFFVVVETLNNERRIKNFVYILLASSFLLGIDGIYQYFTHKDFIRHRPYYDLPRIHTTFPTPNDFGAYLVTIIPFALICSFTKSVLRLIRFLATGLLLLLFICLMLTVSRGSWLAFMSAMLFMSIWIRALAVFFLALGIFIVITQQFYFPYLKDRLNQFFIFGDTSSMDRRIIWQTGWKMFISKPLLGLGLGTFMFNFRKFIKDYQFGVPYAHNCYLQMGAETGIIGLVAFLLILLLLFYQGIKSLNKSKKSFHWYILLASLASLLGYCVQMAVDTIFYSVDLGILFWLLLGLGFGSIRNIELENNKK